MVFSGIIDKIGIVVAKLLQMRVIIGADPEHKAAVGHFLIMDERTVT